MKKFLTALVSMMLAGTMAFGLAACGGNTNPEGSDNNNQNNNSNNSENNNNNSNNTENTDNTTVNKALLDAIKTTTAAEKYKLTVNEIDNYTVFYNGNKLEADTVISTPDGNITGLDLLNLMVEDEDFEGFENPVTYRGGETIYSFDFAGGLVKMEDTYDDEVEITYYEATGTTINRYVMNRQGIWNEETGELENETLVPGQYSYTGYASEAQAKQVLKNNLLKNVYGTTLEAAMKAKVKGVGENADKEGTLEELIDLFDYDASTKTYSATVDASSEYGPSYAECKVAITVEDGKVSELVTTVTENESMEDEIPGVTLEMEISTISKYSDIGTVSVAIDENYKGADEENIHVTHVVATEVLWKELLTDFATTEFQINYYTFNTDGQTHHTFYVDTESKTAMTTLNGDQMFNRCFYRVENDKVAMYQSASYDDPLLADKTYDITGDALTKLIECVDEEYVTDYYAGFDDGKLSDLFSKFEFTSFYELAAHLKLNGKDVTVYLSFYYDNYEEKQKVNHIEIEYSDETRFYVLDNAKDQLEYWASRIETE